MRLVGEHAQQDPLVGLVGYHLLVQLLFSFAAFRCQDVPPIRVASDNLARARLFEPLGRTLMGLQFRRKKCSSGELRKLRLWHGYFRHNTMVAWLHGRSLRLDGGHRSASVSGAHRVTSSNDVRPEV